MKEKEKIIYCKSCSAGSVNGNIHLASCKRKLGEPFHKKKISRHENRVVAISMINEGYSYRQVMAHLGYKSPASISKLLNKSNANKS